MLTFHFSSSSCLALYCLTRSSRTIFRPSEFVLSAGSTSFTVCSMRTPLMSRNALRSPESGCRVSNTNLSNSQTSGKRLVVAHEGEAPEEVPKRNKGTVAYAMASNCEERDT